jgi:hypothetical protein
MQPVANRPNGVAQIAGTWRGFVRADRDSVSLVVDARADGSVVVRYGDQSEAVMTAPSFSDSVLAGRFFAPLPAPDATPAAERSRIVVVATLRLRNGKLAGWLSAITQAPPVYGAVSYYAELSR